MVDWLEAFFGPLGLFKQTAGQSLPPETQEQINQWERFLFQPLGPFTETLDKVPPWFNDNNVFLGGTALGALLLSGGAIPRLVRDKTAPRKRRKALKREKKPKTDYYEVLARSLDKAQLPASYAVASVLSQPIIALPFAISYIQGAENFHLIKKATGDRLQTIAGALFGGVIASKIAGAVV